MTCELKWLHNKEDIVFIKSFIMFFYDELYLDMEEFV